jgi:uncharacterized protein YpmB
VNTEKIETLIRILRLIIELIYRIVYILFSRIIQPKNEQEAEAISKLSYGILFDPLNIRKDKS